MILEAIQPIVPVQIGIASTFTPGTNSYTIAGSTIDFSGGDQTIASFTYNNLTTSGSGTFTAGTSSTVNLNGTGAQTLNVSQFNYANVTLNNTSASGVALGAAVTATNITGDLRLQSGIFNNGGFAIALATDKSFRVVESAIRSDSYLVSR